MGVLQNVGEKKVVTRQAPNLPKSALSERLGDWSERGFFFFWVVRAVSHIHIYIGPHLTALDSTIPDGGREGMILINVSLSQ